MNLRNDKRQNILFMANSCLIQFSGRRRIYSQRSRLRNFRKGGCLVNASKIESATLFVTTTFWIVDERQQRHQAAMGVW